MPRGKIVVAWAFVGWSSSFPDIGAYEFQTSAFSTAVDTRHVSSSDGLVLSDLFNKIESDPLWPYKKGVCALVILRKISKT